MNTSDFLANTEKLFEALEIIQVSTVLEPKKDHWVSHVKLLDFQFNRRHLIDRLKGSIVAWCFTHKEAKRIFEEEFGDSEDYSNAVATLYSSASETFRTFAPQGQFGELLLSAFLQHLFQAPPLLRKQIVRTSDSHERFGADAIHFSNQQGNNLYLGESKCYESSYRFPSAFAKSLASMNTTLTEFATEIKKFSAGNFIEEEMRPIADSILRNQIENFTINPVILIIYNETHKFTTGDSSSIKQEILETVHRQCQKIGTEYYDDISAPILAKYIYIVMPVWELDKLLDEFVKSL